MWFWILGLDLVVAGDAAEWTTGQKAEIVTELASLSATVCAAWTEVTSTGFMDFAHLKNLLGRPLAQRVVLKENLAIATAVLDPTAVGVRTTAAP